MNKVYLELLADEDVVDDILRIWSHPRLTLFKTEILTNENYDAIVTAHLNEDEETP